MQWSREANTSCQCPIHGHMATSIRNHQPVRALRPVYCCHITLLIGDLAKLLCKGRTAVVWAILVTQQPQHIPAPCQAAVCKDTPALQYTFFASLTLNVSKCAACDACS